MLPPPPGAPPIQPCAATLDWQLFADSDNASAFYLQIQPTPWVGGQQVRVEYDGANGVKLEKLRKGEAVLIDGVGTPTALLRLASNGTGLVWLRFIQEVVQEELPEPTAVSCAWAAPPSPPAPGSAAATPAR